VGPIEAVSTGETGDAYVRIKRKKRSRSLRTRMRVTRTRVKDCVKEKTESW